jgi:hypothetical protein
MYTIDGGKLRKHIIIHPDSDSDSESDNEGQGLYAGGGGLYAGRGGSVKSNFKKAGLYAPGPNGGSVKSDFKKAGKYITAKKGGLASALVDYGIPAVTSGLGGAAAVTLAPAGGPLSGLAGSQLGGYAGRQLSKYIDSSAGTGFVPPSGPNKRSNLPRVAYTGGFQGSVGSSRGGKLKGDLVKSYNKVVPKSLQPAVNELAGQVGNYALDKAGYGEPIPVKGNGLKKGSQAAKDHMARIRAMRKK